MEKLKPGEYEIARNLLAQIEYQTVLKTIMAGETPGVIYVDSKKKPKLAFAQFKQRTFLSGVPSTDLGPTLRNFFNIRVREHCQEYDAPFFRLTNNHPQWLDIMVDSLDPREPIITGYHCYQRIINTKIENISLPDGYEIIPVDQELINAPFPGREDLLEEMCSERESVDAFLGKSFGVAAFKDDALAGWCLSEYNYEDQCEVGIATMPPYRRIGLAKAMATIFSNQAFDHGIKKILWHCFETNLPSRKTALSAGFSLVDSHKVAMLYWDTALNQAVHGNINFEQGNYEDALIRYEKSLNQENPQHWMAFNAACTSVHLNQPKIAIEYLNLAIDLGFADLEYLVANKHLEPLKEDPKWGEIIFRVNQKLQSES